MHKIYRVGNMRFFTVVLMMFALGSCKEPSMPSPFHAADVTSRHAQAGFQLKDFDGNPRNLQDFKEKVVVLYFGYIHCPDACPTTLADLAQVMRLLGKQADRVQVLLITLDPERDRPELIKQFVQSFDSSFIGLAGDAQTTAAAAQSFGVSYAKRPDSRGGYSLDHSDGLYLLGMGAKPLLLSPYGRRTEHLLSDIRLLLAIGR